MSHCTHSVRMHNFHNSNCSQKHNSIRDARHSTEISNMDPLDDEKKKQFGEPSKPPENRSGEMLAVSASVKDFIK